MVLWAKYLKNGSFWFSNSLLHMNLLALTEYFEYYFLGSY